MALAHCWSSIGRRLQRIRRRRDSDAILPGMLRMKYGDREQSGQDRSRMHRFD
jgi:hypothetical protein